MCLYLYPSLFGRKILLSPPIPLSLPPSLPPSLPSLADVPADPCLSSKGGACAQRSSLAACSWSWRNSRMSAACEQVFKCLLTRQSMSKACLLFTWHRICWSWVSFCNCGISWCTMMMSSTSVHVLLRGEVRVPILHRFWWQVGLCRKLWVWMDSLV